LSGHLQQHANPVYSGAILWDGNAATVKNWIDATKETATSRCAFDFPFRFTVRDASTTPTGPTWATPA
jgi:hypothetical protein